ncbi:hypothetical protein CIHG_07498 [Coccidioides immitis H538.4]|nr:hypothetical protein CIHG_07498 [Coccidioides immitis H538.4]
MDRPSAVHVGEPSKDKRPAIQPNAQKFMRRITALKLMSNFSSMCWDAGAYMVVEYVCLLERDIIVCVLEHNDTENRILLTFLPVQRIQGVCRRLWKHCIFHSRTLRSTYVYVGIIPSIFGLGRIMVGPIQTALRMASLEANVVNAEQKSILDRHIYGALQRYRDPG